jgi:NDP-sugar pyrophosphorylase family protein
MYPIGGRPVMDYLLERMALAGCREIRVVTRPDKKDVSEHARQRGATVLFGRPPTVSASLLMGLAGVDAEARVLFGFPDTLWQPRDGFVPLLEALQRGASVALGIFRAAEPRRSDVVTLEGDRVTAIAVKPERPSSDLVWGCAAVPARLLEQLEPELEPGLYFHRLARRGLVRGIRLADPFVDIGTPESLRRAQATPPPVAGDEPWVLSGEGAV